MSDEAKQTANPTVTAAKPASTTSHQKTWVAILWICALISLACLIWMVTSLTKVTDYVSSVNQLEVSASNIVKHVDDATFSQDPEVSAAAYDSLSNDVQAYSTALTTAQQKATDSQDVFNNLADNWQNNKEKIDFVLSHRNEVDALQDLQSQFEEATRSLQTDYQTATEQAVAAGLPVAAINSMQTQLLRAERLNGELVTLNNSTDGTPADFQELSNAFAQTLAEQQESYGEAARPYKTFLPPITTSLPQRLSSLTR